MKPNSKEISGMVTMGLGLQMSAFIENTYGKLVGIVLAVLGILIIMDVL
jgi:hypothetical protein